MVASGRKPQEAMDRVARALPPFCLDARLTLNCLVGGGGSIKSTVPRCGRSKQKEIPSFSRNQRKESYVPAQMESNFHCEKHTKVFF